MTIKDFHQILYYCDDYYFYYYKKWCNNECSRCNNKCISPRAPLIGCLLLLVVSFEKV